MGDNTNPPQGNPIDLRNIAESGGSGAVSQQTGQTAGQPKADDQSLFGKFEISETVRKQYPDLIPLILQTESMSDDERQYWFQILPIMTDDQVTKLREILSNEKNQLAALDKDYDQELKAINARHIAEWKAFEAKEKREKLKEAEVKAEKVERETEEDLLNKLKTL